MKVAKRQEEMYYILYETLFRFIAINFLLAEVHSHWPDHTNKTPTLSLPRSLFSSFKTMSGNTVEA